MTEPTREALLPPLPTDRPPTFDEISSIIERSHESLKRDVAGKLAGFYSAKHLPEQVHESYYPMLPKVADELSKEQMSNEPMSNEPIAERVRKLYPDGIPGEDVATAFKKQNPDRSVIVDDTELGQMMKKVQNGFDEAQRDQLWRQISDKYSAAVADHSSGSFAAVANAQPDRIYADSERLNLDANPDHAHITNRPGTELEMVDGQPFSIVPDKYDKFPQNSPVAPGGKQYVN